MSKIEDQPQQVAGMFRLQESGKKRRKLSQRFKDVIFNILTCNGMFWPERFANAKIEQEEAKAKLLDAEANLKNAQKMKTLAEGAKVYMEVIATLSSADNLKKNELASSLSSAKDATIDEIVANIEVIVAEIKLNGGDVNFHVD